MFVLIGFEIPTNMQTIQATNLGADHFLETLRFQILPMLIDLPFTLPHTGKHTYTQRVQMTRLNQTYSHTRTHTISDQQNPII